MKLLLCKKCYDVVALAKHRRRCECGKVEGKYTDGDKAEYSGDAIPFAIDNGSFMSRSKGDAERNVIYDSFYGKDKIWAWILTGNAPNVETIKKVKRQQATVLAGCGGRPQDLKDQK